ncbi:hypothetical protein ABZ734_22395 [Streptomyces sp. NPDC006660]|uniref:hypothetical protein n=1 Tax=Streptomyces sp. NPDC006660 TaxID=3156901 RepID=UPI0033DD6EE2
MSTYTRTSLRAAIATGAVATAAVAGALLTPATAFAQSGPCQVTEKIPSAFGGMSVSLTSDPGTGPIAVLRDADGKAVATVDRAHPTDLADGIKIEEPRGGAPVFYQRSQGGDTAWQSHAFPALPKSCTETGVTYKLVDGESVKVTKSGPGQYSAVTATGGKSVTVLQTRATGWDADGFHRGMHVTLSSKTGQVYSEYTNSRSGCTVSTVVTSVFHDGDSVKLTIGPQGPKAVLRDSALKAGATVDRAHPSDLGAGVIIEGAKSATPKLGQRTQGGSAPYTYSAFPELPAGCASGTPAKADTGATVSAAKTPANVPVQNGGQTTVVPQGAVAAGAEFQQGGSDTGVLVAGGAATAAVAGGIGFVALRRRAAARV